MSIQSDLIAMLELPMPYHVAMRALRARGYPVGQISSTMNALATNSGSHATGCTGLRKQHLYYTLDGVLQPFEAAWCSKGTPEVTNHVATVKQQLNGKQLILLPCNPSAMCGNYFKSNSWETFSKWFPERMTTLDFAAVDCITTETGDGQGLIVFEHEMDRVKGWDVTPVHTAERLATCVQGYEISLPRLTTYELILVCLNVRLYREAVMSTLLPSMIVFDLAYNQSSLIHMLPEIRAEFEARSTA